MTNPVDIEVYYNTHLPTAQALPASSILAARVDYDLAIVNVETGMHVVIEHADEIALHFPKLNVNTLKALHEIALATKYAAIRVEQEVPAESHMAARLSEARDLQPRGTIGVGTGDFRVARHPVMGMRHTLLGRQERQNGRERIDREALTGRQMQRKR